MKKLFLLLAVLCQMAYAAHYYEVDTSVNDIETAYDAASAGTVLGACGVGPYGYIINDTSSDIFFGVGKNVSTIPSADGGPVPDGTSISLDNYISFNGVAAIFIRSKTGAKISSDGSVYLQCGRITYDE